MLGSIAAIVAAIVIAFTGWMPIDPLLSLAVAGLILHSAWGLLRTSSHILLEGAPDWLDVGALRAEMMVAVPGITDVHHVHTWMITAERPMMTLHVEVEPSTNHQTALTAVRAYIRDHVGIDHATIQIETTGCVDAERSGSAAGEAHDGAHASRSAAS
jgi:cobalt-zinc-cadmium efflux system protein